MSRRRACNFSSEEIKVLVKLINENNEILANKRADNLSSKLKEETWLKIKHEFNCQVKIPRSTQTLRKKYENLKREHKMRKSTMNLLNYDQRELSSIMGDHEDARLKLSLSPIKVASTTWDYEDPGDGIVLSEKETEEDIEEILGGDNHNWENTHTMHSPSNLRARKREPEKFSSWTHLAEVKAMWTQEKYKAEIELMKAEHLQKIKHLEEKHELEINTLKNDYENKKTINNLQILKLRLEISALKNSINT